MRGLTVAFETHGRVGLMVHGERDPDLDEWREALNELSRLVHTLSRYKIFIVSPGATLPASHRRILIDALSDTENLHAALVTDSRMARGAMTALRWFLPFNIRAFSPHDFAEATEFLALDPAQRQWLRLTIPALEAHLNLTSLQVSVAPELTVR